MVAGNYYCNAIADERSVTILGVEKQPAGGSFSLVAGSKMRVYGPRYTTSDGNTGGVCVSDLLIPLEIGDSIRMRVGKIGENFDIQANGCYFSAVRMGD